MKGIAGDGSSVTDQFRNSWTPKYMKIFLYSQSYTERKIVIRIFSEPFPLQKKFHNPTSRGWREELGVVVIKEVVLVPGVGGGVLGLETVLGEQFFARVERLLDLLQPGLQSVMDVREERNSKIFTTKE